MEAEAFAERVAQPLLLQAPLQAVLLDLFRQLQAHNVTIDGLQLSLGALDAREREGREAARQAAADASAALQRLQSQIAAERLAAEQGRREADARLLRLELRLHGASNLAGRQAALDDIATMLGVHVPEAAPPASAPPAVGLGGTMGGLAATAAATTADPASSSDRTGSRSAADCIGATAGTDTEQQQSVASVPAVVAASTGSGEQAANSAAVEANAEAAAARSSTAQLPGTLGHQAAVPGSGEGGAASRSASAAGTHTPASGASSRSASPLGASGSGGSQQQGRSATATADAQTGLQTGVLPVGSGYAKVAAPTAAGEPWQAASRGATSSDGQGDVSAVHTASLEGEMHTRGIAKPGYSVAPVPAHSLPSAHTTGGDSTPSFATAQPQAAVQPAGVAPQSHQFDATDAASAAPAQRVGVRSPAALFAAMQAGKAKPAPAGTQPAAAALRSTTPSMPASSSSAQQAAAAPEVEDAVAVQDSEPATPRIVGSGSVLQPATGASGSWPAGAGEAAALRPKSAAQCRLADVVNMLRKRPNLQHTGLLWKLQASLTESLDEQERLKGEVVSLQEKLASVQSSSGEGLERCNLRIDGVQALVEAQGANPADAFAESSSSDGASTARSLTPRVSIGEFKALEERVGALGSKVRSGAEQLSGLDAKLDAELAGVSGQVASTAERVQRLEALREVEAAAVKLARASSTGSREDTLGALQGHLLAQQQKLQAQMEALAGGIKQGLAGQVHDAVTGAVVEVGRGLERRLSERLATKQDLQTLSSKVGSKVSREEVERMLRQHRPATAAAEPGSGPAAGMRFKCISCDSDMQPFVFAAPLGSLPPYGGTTGGTADLRYSQVPVASPPRNSTQHWTAAVGGSPHAAPAAGPETSRLSSNASATAVAAAVGAALPMAQVQMPLAPPGQAPLSARPSTAASRLGASVSWMHRMRRDTGGASLDGAGPASSRRDSMQEQRRESVQEQLLQHQPSLTAVGLGRPQTAMPVGGGGSGATPRPAGLQQGRQEQDADLYDVVRDEPQLAGTSSNASAAGEVAADDMGEQGARSARGSLAGGGSSKGQALPALQGSPGRIRAVRPSTSQPALPSAASADGEAQRSSTTAVAASGAPQAWLAAPRCK